MPAGRDRVLRQRLGVQRLTSAPLADPADVVRLLTCVQAQDAPLARFSLGLRTAGATDADIRRTLDSGHVIRTHILRPTWHFVAAEDLRWILDLTSAKVVSGLAARHRQLGLDAGVVHRALDRLPALLDGRQFLTRREITTAFRDAGIAGAGDQVGHLLLLAELRGLICSGPLRGQLHTYALADELIRATPERARDEAVRELVLRFFAGHGPAAVTDLTRWTTLTQAEIRPALADLGDRLETVTVDGATLWFDPELVPRSRPGPHAFLLPTFDEIYLSYPGLNFPRADAHPRGSEPHSFAEAGGGVVVCDREDIGWWKRQELAGQPHITLSIALAADVDQRRRGAVDAAARRLAAFTRRRLVLELI